MKLKEQFRKTNLSTWINEVDTEKLENIADEYAIEFAEWYAKEGKWIKYRDGNTSKELLEIYKKEKEL
jgi:hypothetical protein